MIGRVYVKPLTLVLQLLGVGWNWTKNCQGPSKLKMPKTHGKPNLIEYIESDSTVTLKPMKSWIERNFEVSVHEVDYHKKIGRIRNVIVLLDNAPGHPNPESLERSPGRFRVKYFPANVAPLIQPMDQTVIAALKTNYRRMILADLINWTMRRR